MVTSVITIHVRRFEARWLERLPTVSKIPVEEPPATPLTSDECSRLLDPLNLVNPKRWGEKQQPWDECQFILQR